MWEWGGRALKSKQMDKLSLVCPDKRELDDPYGLVLTRQVSSNNIVPHLQACSCFSATVNTLTLAVFSLLNSKLR